MKLRITQSPTPLLPIDPNLGVVLVPKTTGGGGGGDGCLICFENFTVAGDVVQDLMPVPANQITLNFIPENGPWSAVVTANGEFCGADLTWRVEHHYKLGATEPMAIISNGGNTIQVAGDETNVLGRTYAQLYVNGTDCTFPLGPRVLIKDLALDENCQFCFHEWIAAGDLGGVTDSEQVGYQFAVHTNSGPWEGTLTADMDLCDFQPIWHYEWLGTTEGTVEEDFDVEGNPRLNITGTDAATEGTLRVWMTVRRNEAVVVVGDPLCEFQVGPVVNLNPSEDCSSVFTETVDYPQDLFFESFADFFSFGDYDIVLPVLNPSDPPAVVSYYFPVEEETLCISTPGRMSATVEHTSGLETALDVTFAADTSGGLAAIRMDLTYSDIGLSTDSTGDTWLISVFYDDPLLGSTQLGGNVVGAISGP